LITQLDKLSYRLNEGIAKYGEELSANEKSCLLKNNDLPVVNEMSTDAACKPSGSKTKLCEEALILIVSVNNSLATDNKIVP